MLATGDALGSPTNPLRWVPDLVGKKSGGKGAVMIIGSAYAPFVAGYTRRCRAMSLQYYRQATRWQEFAFNTDQGFLEQVVGGSPRKVRKKGARKDDPNYYRKIANMLNGPGPVFDLSRLILTDWCRASLVARGKKSKARVDKGGDFVCGKPKGLGIFFAYAEQNFDWHKKRFSKFNGKLIILGSLAHDCLKFFCLKMNWRVTYHSKANRRVKVSGAIQPGGFCDKNGNLSVIGRIHIPTRPFIEFAVASHPGARGKYIYPKPKIRKCGSLLTWLKGGYCEHFVS